MLFCWIRKADLEARDFSRVWAIRQGYFGDEEGDEEEEAGETPDGGAQEGGG